VQVLATSLLLSESVSATKRLPVVRVETRGCRTDLRLQPEKLGLDFRMQTLIASDLCAHGTGIAEVLLSRAEPPGALVHILIRLSHVHHAARLLVRAAAPHLHAARWRPGRDWQSLAASRETLSCMVAAHTKRRQLSPCCGVSCGGARFLQSRRSPSLRKWRRRRRRASRHRCCT